MAYLKIVASSMGIVVLALLLKLCMPMPLLFPVSQLPMLSSWLKPPYVYVVINVIVIAIAVSSKLHLNQSEKPPGQLMIIPSPAEFDFDRELMQKEEMEFGGSLEPRQPATVAHRDSGDEDGARVVMEVVDSEEDKFVISREIIVLPDEDEDEPLVSARLERQKPVKSTHPGEPALMSTLKRHETLENTWKAITEGRSVPLSIHKENDTWMNYEREMEDSEVHPEKMVKSETFKDRTNYTSRSTRHFPSKLRKEPSLSQDELNRRVEAFIKKFNEEMRLQRQESLNQHKEMINRGV